MNLMEFTSTKNRSYALHPGAIRCLDGDEKETRVLASIAGVPLTFRVKRPYAEVMEEWRKAVELEGEQGA